MTARHTLFSLVLSAAALCTAPLHAQAKPGDLDVVLRHMDEASTKFQSAEADFRWDLYERVIKQTTTQNGSIYFVRKGSTTSSSTEMGAKIQPPSARFLEYKGGKLRIFDPVANHLQELKAGDKQAMYESFLTLGFGGSGKDLAKAWTITYQGAEPLTDGDKKIDTAKLDLVSKDPGVRNMFTHITIWVDPARGISLKQQFFTPSEDQKIAFYSHIRYNQKVDTGTFALKTNGKTN